MPHPLSPSHLNSLNLKVLRKHCPGICAIYDQASYVVLYRSVLVNPNDPNDKTREWSKKDVHVEGSMFLVEFETEPRHGFYILNREGLSDFKHVFRAGDKFEAQTDYIIFKPEDSSQIWGIWVFEPDQRKRFAKKFLYYHALESDPTLVLEPDSPIELENGEIQPQTVDELFQRLAVSEATKVEAPTPPPNGTTSSSKGRKRGESISAKVGQQRYAEAQQEERREQAVQQYPVAAGPGKGKKGKNLQRPKSVPPQGGLEQQQQQPPRVAHPLPPRPDAASSVAQGRAGAQADGMIRVTGGSDDRRALLESILPPAGSTSQAPPHHDPSTDLMQIFGIAPAPSAPSAPKADGRPVGPRDAPPPAPRPEDSYEFPPQRGGSKGAALMQTQAIPHQQQQQPSSQLSVQARHSRRKSTQYIPQTTTGEASLVDEGVVRNCVAEKMGRSGAGKGKVPVTQREFVQEVLKLIHTDKEWTKALYEEYLARSGGVIVEGSG